jgi:predicted phage terminase large subunit-like protein
VSSLLEDFDRLDVLRARIEVETDTPTPYLPYAWVRLLNQKLVDLAARRSRFLIVEAPVRHGKSELGSKWFPAWYLGQFPDHRVILGGHSVPFARKFGRSVRGIIGQFGPPLFGVSVASGREERDDYGARILGRSYAADDWTLAFPYEGGMVSVGRGNPPTGRGGNLITIDDPIKSSDEAYSPTVRESLWQWYQFDIRTRLEPDGVIVLIMSRWHEDDLTGRLLKRMEEGTDDDSPVDVWEILHLPALADDEIMYQGRADPLDRARGEPLCPQRYNRDALLMLRNSIGSIAFDALLQNSPRPPEGTLFKRSNWKFASGVKAGLSWRRWWDMAATERSLVSSNPDWTAGVLIARDNETGYTWIANVTRTREEAEEVERFTAAMDLGKYGCNEVRLPQDPGSAGKSLVSYYGRRVLNDLPVRVRGETQSGDKVARAIPLAGQQGLGNIILVRGAWNEDFVEECAAFPRGTHDDMVDAAALGYQDIAGLLRGQVKVIA